MNDLTHDRARLESFVGLFKTETLWALAPDAMLRSYHHLFAIQEEDGSWRGDGDVWVVSKTAVVVRSLCRLRFRLDATWPRANRSLPRGGVRPAVNFLKEVVGDVAKVAKKKQRCVWAGDDSWDHCQVLLAVHAYERGFEEVQRLVNDLCKNWREYFESGEERKRKWYGPAFLAAMIDVAVMCDPNPAVFDLEEMVTALLDLEQDEENRFPSRYPQNAPHSWHAAQVLRTLSRMAGAGARRLATIERTAVGLLDLHDANGLWRDGTEVHHAMVTARCLEGLFAARPEVSRDVRERIDAAVVEGNRWLNTIQGKDQLFGDVKATTVVLGYFSSLTLGPSVPLVLAAEASSIVSSSPGVLETRWFQRKVVSVLAWWKRQSLAVKVSAAGIVVAIVSIVVTLVAILLTFK